MKGEKDFYKSDSPMGVTFIQHPPINCLRLGIGAWKSPDLGPRKDHSGKGRSMQYIVRYV
jgi:hypothetical protein